MAPKSLKRKPNRKRSSSKSVSSMAYLLVRKVFILTSIILVVCVILVLGVLSTTRNKISPDDLSIQFYDYEVVNEFPHDSSAFTQGLVYGGNDTLFESTGLYKRSSVRKVTLQTGKVEIIQKMADSYFGEGLTLLSERLFQVTWLTNIGFIYDRKQLQKLEVVVNCIAVLLPHACGKDQLCCIYQFDQFTHQMEDGWGLATDGKILYGSDGTSKLYQIDPQTFKVTKEHQIKFNGHDVRYLNELEYINGEIWANVWQSDCIARISPNNGTVLGWIILQTLREGLISAGYNGIDVLNGIAWDSNKNRIFVTGKLWPKLYEIKLHPAKKHYNNGDIEQLCLR
ncbi:hypothetical protein DITRI_Ditri07aG0088200 [Diplodiscus trichospermus]